MFQQHGLPRPATAVHRTEEEVREEQRQIQEYRDLEDLIRAKVGQQSVSLYLAKAFKIAERQYTVEVLELTSKLLKKNPEYYTIWNVRRRLLIHGFFSEPSHLSSPSTESPSISQTATTTASSASSSSSPANISAAQTTTPHIPASRTLGKNGTTLDIISADLAWLVPIMISYPKCYWIWNYRFWLLQQANERLEPDIARQLWNGELKLVGKMLVRDTRNFHGWGYRRKVVSQLESAALHGSSMAEGEFEYTTKMITSPKGLSNFSAFHRRSKIIPKLLDERGADDQARRIFLEEGAFSTKITGSYPNLSTRIRPHYFSHVHRFLPLRTIGLVLLPIPDDNINRPRRPCNYYTKFYKQRARRICHTTAGGPQGNAGGCRR